MTFALSCIALLVVAALASAGGSPTYATILTVGVVVAALTYGFVKLVNNGSLDALAPQAGGGDIMVRKGITYYVVVGLTVAAAASLVVVPSWVFMAG